MNAAFLLATTALLAGDNPAAPQAKAAAAPAPVVAPANGCGTGCGGCCDTCSEEGCLKRLFSRFHRNSCGCDTCGTTSTTTCNTGCDECGKHSLFGRFHRGGCGCDSCGTTSCGSSCDCGCEEGILRRLFGRFHHHNDCCDTCGNGCCGNAAAPAIVPAPGAGPKGELIPPPKEPGKKMPAGKDSKEVRIVPPQPIAPPVLEVTPVTAPKSADSPF